MIWLNISKIYARLFCRIKDKFKYNIRGFGFVMRRIKSDTILNLYGSQIFFNHREAIHINNLFFYKKFGFFFRDKE